MTRDRIGALCGLLGPTAFVGAWLLAGARTEGYDPLEQAIARDAALGLPQRD